MQIDQSLQCLGQSYNIVNIVEPDQILIKVQKIVKFA